MNKVILWFDSLSLRERLLVGLAIPLIILTMVYLTFIEPMQKQRTNVLKRIDSATAQLNEMQSFAGLLLLVEKREDISEIFGQYLDNGVKNKLKSRPLDEESAKMLFIKLAQRGKVELSKMNNNKWIVWFES